MCEREHVVVVSLWRIIPLASTKIIYMPLHTMPLRFGILFRIQVLSTSSKKMVLTCKLLKHLFAAFSTLQVKRTHATSDIICDAWRGIAMCAFSYSANNFLKFCECNIYFKDAISLKLPILSGCGTRVLINNLHNYVELKTLKHADITNNLVKWRYFEI